MSDVLVVEGLRKRFRRFEALKGVDLRVKEGEIFGFLGANGAGKTTFTKCVTGFLKPDEGRISIHGVNALRNRSKALQYVGIVPDEYSLYEDLTGFENLDYYASLYGLTGAQKRRRIKWAVHIVGMEEKGKKKAKAFSHGMKQRICIAQALLHKPKLIILDEPTNGLDPRGAYELRMLMRSLVKHGTSVFLNSHVMSEVEQVCDRVAIVREGTVIAVGTPKEIQAKVGGIGKTLLRVKGLQTAHVTAAKRAGNVRASGPDELEVIGGEDAVADVVAAVVGAGGRVVGMRDESGGLERSFLALTGDA